MYVSDEGYYGTIANDILDGGAVYHTAVDTKPPGMYYIYAAVFQVAGRNNLLAVHILAILVVAATALVVRGIGARVADDWAGAWSGIGYAMFAHAYGICHVKDGEVDEQSKASHVDLAKAFATLKKYNYKGYCSIEYDAPGDPYKPTSTLVEQTVKFLS